MTTRQPRADVHQEITNQIIAMLDTATGIADCPWYRTGATERPRNAITKNVYHGINVVSLWASSMRQGFTSGYWGTYRQWDSIGAQVRTGEKGTRSVFYKTLEKEGDAGEVVTVPFARSVAVFAAEQVDGFELPELPSINTVQAMSSVDALIHNSGASIHHGGERAFYRQATDSITLPDIVRFDDTESYYAVLLHELIHWTAHACRCDRSAIKSYAFEELVAELGAAFLCADLHITAEPREDHAKYLAGWLEALRGEPTVLTRASRLASQAAEYVLQFHLKSQQAGSGYGGIASLL